MSFLVGDCTLRIFDKTILETCEEFNCGDEDLNEFFRTDVLAYDAELLGKSYCFTLDSNPNKIVAAFTLANDSIKTFILPNARKKKVIAPIPRVKHMKSYPAVMIGRLGVAENYRRIGGQDKSTGDQLMDFIKAWFIDSRNKTGCRFIVVDAFNNEKALRFYDRNNFVPLFSNEEQEKEVSGIKSELTLASRLLYFDLIVLK
ncbi:MAG: GNAT family N-acetyltransferase [Bacteroidetes bacterium]|nr:GNAT family N-acetyltransferase [Bacteroidota bacterium]NCQ12220.1 GNAT family N-acetyltransferase [Bacteroidota bacterium]